MKKLIVLSAPSGAGKTTLCQRLLGDFPKLRLSISSTTRAPRGRERNGKEYFFLSHEEFERSIHEKRFAEWAQVHGHYYGTAKATIDQALRDGAAVLLDIDVQGAESLRRAYPKETLTFFISPPSLDVLEQRLRARGTDAEETIQKRLKNARAEMEQTGRFDHVIVNDDLERAYSEVKAIVGKELGDG